MSTPVVQELEQALAMVAYIVLRHGDAYSPLLDRLEREVNEAKRASSYRARAHAILAALPQPPEVRRALAG